MLLCALTVALMLVPPLAGCSNGQAHNAQDAASQGQESDGGGTGEAADASQGAGIPDGAYISVGDAAALMDAEECFVMDIRVLSAYDSVHIEGAISMPESVIGIRIREVPADKTVMIVSQKNELLDDAYQTLVDNGIDPANIKVIEGGMDSWAAADLPMVSVSKYRC